MKTSGASIMSGSVNRSDPPLKFMSARRARILGEPFHKTWERGWILPPVRERMFESDESNMPFYVVTVSYEHSAQLVSGNQLAARKSASSESIESTAPVDSIIDDDKLFDLPLSLLGFCALPMSNPSSPSPESSSVARTVISCDLTGIFAAVFRFAALASDVSTDMSKFSRTNFKRITGRHFHFNWLRIRIYPISLYAERLWVAALGCGAW